MDIRSLKFTAKNLIKTENLLKETGYKIRYERGSFESGVCLLKKEKVVVVSRFLKKEDIFNEFLDLLFNLDLKVEELSLESRNFLSLWDKSKATVHAENTV